MPIFKTLLGLLLITLIRMSLAPFVSLNCIWETLLKKLLALLMVNTESPLVPALNTAVLPVML